MNKNLITGIILLSSGSAAFTWLLTYMQDNHPAALYGMLGQTSFSFNDAPLWMWCAMLIALISIVKGASKTGRSIKKRN